MSRQAIAPHRASPSQESISRDPKIYRSHAPRGNESGTLCVPQVLEQQRNAERLAGRVRE